MNHIKLYFGYKNRNDNIVSIKQINIYNYHGGLIDNSHFNFVFALGGYIGSNKDTNKPHYMSNILKSFQSNLMTLFSKLRETKNIVTRLCIYNPLFTAIPVYCLKTINFKEEKKILEDNIIVGMIYFNVFYYHQL